MGKKKSKKAKQEADRRLAAVLGSPYRVKRLNAQGETVWVEQPWTESRETAAEAARKHWGASNPRLVPIVPKTFASEFPALPGTKVDDASDSSKDGWISPADLESASGDGWGNGNTSSSELAIWTKGVNEWGDPNAPTPEWIDETPPKTEEELVKEKAEAACFGWPWTGVPEKLVTLAPYHLNQHWDTTPLKLPRVLQESGFFTKLMNLEDIAFEVRKYVFQHHSSSWRLAATCQQMWDIMSNKVDIWDMTLGWFNNCDRLAEESNEMDHRFNAGSVSAHLVVTPLRRREGPATYVEQVINLRRLSLSILNFGSSLRNVHFHRTPFLSINTLALFIPQMTKLEVLGIYNCRLMHLGTALKLLDILTVDRMKGKEHSVSLDFYPNYHLGPESGGKYSLGTYGVCWDNLNVDTIRGIWSLVKRIVEKARRQGIDLEGKHTMFRQWLEKTPCWQVGPTLKTFSDPNAAPIEIATMVMYHKTKGDPAELGKMLKYRLDKDWFTRLFRCSICDEVQMGTFFCYSDTNWNEIEGVGALAECLGCMLTFHLRRETDHYKTEKRRIVKAWLRDDDGAWNTTDLRRAIEDYDYHGIEQMAAELDDQRHRDMTEGPDPYDRETQERQRPFTHDETKGKRGAHLRSPEVNHHKHHDKWYHKDRRFWERWMWVDESRYDCHGMHY